MALEKFIWGDVDAVMDEATDNEQEDDDFFTPAVSTVSFHSTKFERFSIFGDSDCGEPSKAQHLVLDFTPDEDFDNPASQKKCCEFWEYINSQPDIQHLCVKPDPDLDVDYNESTTSSESSPAEPEVVEEPDKEITAVSTISLYEKKGILKPAFAPKMCVSKCSFGNQEYSTLPLPRIRVCSCTGVCNKVCERVKPKEISKARARARTHALCDEMDRWDEKHPNCRPVCKNRRREWKGEIQQTSGELLIERKPIAECIRQWPTRVYPNSPCPLFGKSKKVITERYSHKPSVVRICQAPIDLVVPTPYLKAAKLVTENGALDLVDTRNCPFCTCGECCPCTPKEYPLHDPDREATRRTSMRAFDARVKDEIKQFRVMYN